MIRARAGNFVFLGLEARNVELLKDGRPLPVRLAELGLPDITVVVVYGDTQADIIALLERETGLKVPTINPVNDKPI